MMKRLYFVFVLLMSAAFCMAQNSNVFTSTSSWLCPAGVTSVQVEAWGGGGGGGGTALNPSVGGGGAGGAYVISTVPVVPGTTYTVTIGAGGTAGSSSGGNGGTGGGSWFNTIGTVLAIGGAGGAGGISGTPSGAGGTGSATGSIGATFYAGGNGTAGLVSNYSGAGGGGAGNGAAGGDAVTSTGGAGGATGGGTGASGRISNGAGQTGTAPGGGGSGGYRASSSTRTGGTGGAGKIILTYTCSAINLPYSENFDGVTTPSIPGCTTGQDINADGTTWVTTTSNPSSAPNALKYAFSFSNAADDWWFTPGLNLTPGNTYKITFKYRILSSGYAESIELKTGTSATAAAMGTTALWSVTNDNTHVTYQTITAYCTATAAVQYFGWHANSQANKDGIFLDDINISVLPVDDAGITGMSSFCQGTQNVSVTLQNFGSNTLTSANINWTVNGVAQPAFSWTGSLATNGTTNVVVGAYTFAPATNYIISATSNSPNSGADANTGNDSYTSGTLQTSLSGTYTVGAGGNYTTLTAAAAAVNTYGLCGPVVFNLTDATYAGETYPVTFSTSTTSATNTLTIKPLSSSTITGSGFSTAAIKILSSYVTIDGSNSGGTDRSLVMINTNATSPNVIIIGSTGTTPIHNVTVKNCTITNGSNSYSTAYSDAVYIGASTLGPGYFNNITIQNNLVQKSYFGIDVIASTTGTDASNVTITKNDLNVSGSSTSIVGIGIYVQGVNGGAISYNNVANMSNSNDDDFCTGIWITTGSSNFSIINNSVSNLTYSGDGFSNVETDGILISSGVNNTIENNKIDNISQTSSGEWAAYGIHLFNSATNLNCMVRNNFIGNVYAYGYSGSGYNGYGLAIDAGSGYSIYNNTINLNTNQTLSSGLPAAMYVSSNVTTAGAIDLRNNIFSTTQTNGTGNYAIYSGAAKTAFSNIDYNDFYTSGANLGYLSSNRATLANIVTGFSGNVNSLNVKPNFTSNTDLHLTAANNCALDGYGTPIASVTTDYDAQARDVAAPDMGADEFTGIYGSTLAASYGSTVSITKNISAAGTTYTAANCDLIAKIVPSGASPVSGSVKVAVTRDPSATNLFFNAAPYLTRHFDIEPATNAATATATVTLYFTDQEFTDYNTNNPLWPAFPTVSGGGNSDPNIVNVQVTQYHGTATTTPSSPGNYTLTPGVGVAVTPAAVNYNGTNWEVTVPVTGFSGFYVYTAYFAAPLPITLNYLRGAKQGITHNLSWSVTCNSTPTATLVLERSANGTDFIAINSIIATALRCQQPFNYADAAPLTGTNYYRLKMIDTNGKITYSNIIVLINAASGLQMMSIAPNPVTGSSFKLNISSAKATPVQIVITDMQGRVVSKQNISLIGGFNSVNIAAGSLAAGTYSIYGTTNAEQTRIIRFVKK